MAQQLQAFIALTKDQRPSFISSTHISGLQVSITQHTVVTVFLVMVGLVVLPSLTKRT